MENRTTLRPTVYLAALVLGSALLSVQRAGGQENLPAESATPEVQRLIVKLRGSRVVQATVASAATWQAFGLRRGVPLNHVRRMSGAADVLQLPPGTSAAQAQALAQQLAADPNVEFVEPDRWVRPAMVPNDPSYAMQWYLQDAAAEIAAANLPAAWDAAAAGVPVTVAVLDTGIVRHADIDPARIYPGYDFIADPFIANDGDGRDADPSDPGDWTTSGDVATQSLCGQTTHYSSWHGTHVAGIVGASAGNGIGIAGVNGNSKLLPVRVLGKCGGYLSDVLDGMRWAAGINDPALPANAHPARVINLSLGSDTPCTTVLQSAVNDVIAAGAVVVAAAGNNAGDAGAVAPGNCAGVIAVGAVDRDGNKAYYSSTGPSISLSAPGGAQYWIDSPSGILSLSNTGTTSASPSPDGDAYTFLQGTSMAAPQVAGVASLMLSVNPALTPEQVRLKLRATARAFPTGSTCTPALCGSGMLDAAIALQSARNKVPPAPDAGVDQEAEPNAVVTLSAAASTAAAPASIAQYRWVQLTGVSVALANAGGVTPTFIAPAQGGTLTFQVTVTDDGGLSATDSVQVRVEGTSFSALNATQSQVGGDSRCFIATAAYGSADAVDVRMLRRFRDSYLMTSAVGRAFVHTYYRLSPPFADAIRPHPWARKLIRIGLVPYVALARWLAVSPAPPSEAR